MWAFNDLDLLNATRALSDFVNTDYNGHYLDALRIVYYANTLALILPSTASQHSEMLDNLRSALRLEGEDCGYYQPLAIPTISCLEKEFLIALRSLFSATFNTLEEIAARFELELQNLINCVDLPTVFFGPTEASTSSSSSTLPSGQTGSTLESETALDSVRGSLTAVFMLVTLITLFSDHTITKINLEFLLCSLKELILEQTFSQITASFKRLSSVIDSVVVNTAFRSASSSSVSPSVFPLYSGPALGFRSHILSKFLGFLAVPQTISENKRKRKEEFTCSECNLEVERQSNEAVVCEGCAEEVHKSCCKKFGAGQFCYGCVNGTNLV